MIPTSLVVSPTDLVELEAEASDGRATLEILKPETLPTAVLNEIHVQVRAKIANLKEKKKSLLDPVATLKKAIESLFSALEYLEKIEGDVRTAMEARALLEIDAEERLRVENQARLQAGEPAVLAVKSAAPENLSFTFSWAYEIEDFSAIPREYLMVDAAKVRTYLKPYSKSSHVPSIPGLRWKREVASRAKARTA